MERVAESKIAEASKSNREVVSDESEKSEGLRSLESREELAITLNKMEANG